MRPILLQLSNLDEMRLFRRGLFAVATAAVFALVLRIRGRGGVPPQRGGWRELSQSDLSQSKPS
jgi:hypothetical protein